MQDFKVFTLALVAFAACVSQSQQATITTCIGQLDLVFMVDASNSVLDRNFRTQMDSLRELTNRLDVRANAIRVGTIVFSSTVDSNAITGSKQQVLNGISRFEYLDESTRTDLGLERAIRLFSTTSRNVTVPKLLMVITDGASTVPQATLDMATSAKRSGIVIFAVGITDAINESELRNMASSPAKVMMTPNFQNIQQVLLDAVSQACTLIEIPTLPPATRPPTSNLCSTSGSMTSGIGFVAHPSVCDKYIQCYYNALTGYHLAVVRHCPLGLHYNARTKDCDWPETVKCQFDPCRQGCKSYPAVDSFRAFWTCENGWSAAHCCGKYQSFVPGKGCVNDTYCMEPCKVGYCLKGRCLKRPVWDQLTSFHYKMDLSARSWLPGYCRHNALDMVTCDCTYNSNHRCNADFMTTFNTPNSVAMGDYLMTSGITVSGRNGVTIGTQGRMRLNLHKTMGNEPMSLQLSFVDTMAPSADGQILMSSNGDCPMAGKDSFVVIYSRDYVKAKLMSGNGQYAYAAVPLSGLNTNLVKNLILSYDNKYLTLSVKVGDLQLVEKARAPKYLNFPCGIDIGPTSTHPGFTGTITQLSLHSCTLSRLY